jgi:hypothetical protein
MVVGRGLSLAVIHADPERRFCYELTRLGVPDGPIQFYRADHSGKASISFKSIYRAARHRTALLDRYPRLETRDDEHRAASRLRASTQDGVSEALGHPSTPKKNRRVREADQCA